MSEELKDRVRKKYAELAQAAVGASLGCGNPTALATLSPGEVVLDLGSGGGIDVLLSARRVSPGGKAYGVDMTGEMLALAEKNKAESSLENAEFLKGEIEDATVEVTNVYEPEAIDGLDTEEDRDALRRVPAASAFVRARKPAEGENVG